MMIPRRQPAGTDCVVSLFLDRTQDLRARGARLILFGSRVREDWRPDSDYDVLVVLPHRDPEIKGRLYGAVVDVLDETGKLVSLKVIDQATYDRLAAIPTPFMANVLREGIPLG
jgi:predicted nucleotidyltransferase